jgi:hypothetical protein
MEYDDKTYEEYADYIKAVERDLAVQFGRSVSKRIIDPNFGNATVQKAYRTADGQAKTTPVKELKKLGLSFQDGIDNLDAGHLQVRKWLHWEEKNNEIIVHPRIYISEECENTIRHMSRYSRKDIETADGDIKDKVKPMDKYKDFPDCTRYFVMANPHYIERQPQQTQETERAY